MAAVHFDEVIKLPPQQDQDTVPLQAMAVEPTTTVAPVPPASWSTGFWECTHDWPSCFDAFFCTPCALSRQYNTYTTGEPVIPWKICLGVFGIDVVAHGMTGFSLGSIAFAYTVRSRLRQRYNIEGSDAWDWASALFCRPCAVAQHYREMSVRGEWPGACCADKPFTLAAPGVPVMVGDGENKA